MSHDNRFSKTNYLKTNLLKQIKKIFSIVQRPLGFNTIINQTLMIISSLKKNYLYSPAKLQKKSIHSK